MCVEFFPKHIPYHNGKDDGRNVAKQAKSTKAEEAYYGEENGQSNVVVTNSLMGCTSSSVHGWLLHNCHIAL